MKKKSDTFWPGLVTIDADVDLIRSCKDGPALECDRFGWLVLLDPMTQWHNVVVSK